MYVFWTTKCMDPIFLYLFIPYTWTQLVTLPRKVRSVMIKVMFVIEYVSLQLQESKRAILGNARMHF